MKQAVLGLAMAGALCALPPSAAMAQYGSSSPPPTAPPSRSDSATVPAAAPASATPGDMLRAASCVIGRDPRAGDALLAASPRSGAERTQAAAFMRSAQRCLRSRDPISVSVITLRGAIAEAAYENQFATQPATRSPAVAAGPVPRAPANDPDSALFATMYSLADCATPRQAGLVRAVLGTEPRSPQETTAFVALHETFGACVPAGTQLTYDPRFMRGFLAEALYRWSVVQRDGAAAPYAAR